MDIIYLNKDDPDYPSAIKIHLGDHAPQGIAVLGSLDILQHKKLALFCSSKCPGNLILQTYDLAQNLRQAGVVVIGGFHSPMERECLRILLRGTQPVIVCPARSITGMRIRSEYKQPLEEGRLLFLSPFTQKQYRITVQTSLYRNQFVAALADHIFVAYAETGSKTEQFCRDVLKWQKPIYLFEGNANIELVALGAKPVSPDANLKEIA